MQNAITRNTIFRRLLSGALLLGLLWLAPLVARADEEGVVRYGVSPASLQNDFFEDSNDNNRSYNELGYRPARLTGYVDNGQSRYFTRWVRNADGRAWKGYFGKTLAEFDATFNTLREQGYHMIDTSGYQTPGGVRFAMLWERTANTPGWKVYRNSTSAGMQTLHDTIGQQGWVPHRVEGYELNGQSHYTSLWYYQPGKGYYIHSKMTREEYDDKLDDYKKLDFIPHHLHAHTVGHTVWYSAIWKPITASYSLRSNRDWRVFQRYYNNLWAAGYNIDNFYAAATPEGVRFGGIWFFDGAPNIDGSSPLSLQMRQAVDGAPARGGAAMINLATGAEVMLHADQVYASASVIKIGILYALLREVDADNIALNDNINSGAAYGFNQGNWLVANTNYTALQMAQFMIRSSNNWATNRLIDALARDGLTGFQVINGYLSEPSGLNLEVTRLNRYMLGGPSAYGNASASADRAAGIESLSTPREMATLLRRVAQEPLLDPLSTPTFWATLNLDGNNDGINNKLYIPSVVTPVTNPGIVIFNKDGSLTGAPREVKADAGMMSSNDGQTLVVYAIFMDEISDDPDVPGVASVATVNAAITALRNAGIAIADLYFP